MVASRLHLAKVVPYVYPRSPFHNHESNIPISYLLFLRYFMILYQLQNFCSAHRERREDYKYQAKK